VKRVKQAMALAGLGGLCQCCRSRPERWENHRQKRELLVIDQLAPVSVHGDNVVFKRVSKRGKGKIALELCSSTVEDHAVPCSTALQRFAKKYGLPDAGLARKDGDCAFAGVRHTEQLIECAELGTASD
jgi:hypothetical protein